MGGALKSRVIICDTCGKEVVTTSGRTLRCRDCAVVVLRKQRQNARRAKRVKNGVNPENNYIWFHDSLEQIQQCLNCKKPSCRNCLSTKR